MSYDHYSRVYASIWLEPWDNDMKLFGVYLLTGPHRRTEGIYRLPLEYAAPDLKWPLKKVRTVLDRLVTAEFIEYDDQAQLVLVVNALKRNGLNANQIKGVVKALRQLPPSPLLERFVSLAKEFNDDLAQGLAEALPRLEVSLAN